MVLFFASRLLVHSHHHYLSVSLLTTTTTTNKGYFNIYSNQFSGTIPSDLRWRQCVQFDVGRNLLTGTLPEDIGEKFVNLRLLHLDHNMFRGTLPANYNNVGNGRLVALSLEYNRLTGMVPGEREIYDNLVQYVYVARKQSPSLLSVKRIAKTI